MARWGPLGAMVLFVAIGVGWRSWLQRRRWGGSGIALFGGDRRRRVSDLGLLVGGALLALQAVLHAWRTPASRPPPTLWIGAGVFAASLVLLIAAQLRLGASWRIGIDEDARPGLVTGGLYRASRNPIFLAMLLGIAGYALMLPTVWSAAALVLAYAGIRHQVGLEERWLLGAYGDQYRVYAARVGRFLPWLGRLR